MVSDKKANEHGSDFVRYRTHQEIMYTSRDGSLVFTHQEIMYTSGDASPLRIQQTEQ